jgi:RHS repeat-associated protein
LGYTYDENGNRATITYPSGAVATYTHDFADRQETLSVDVTPIVTGSSYKSSGPLTTLEFDNGMTETREFDGRYFPSLIRVAGGNVDRDWAYTTDGVGNVEQIVATVACKPADLVIANQTIDQFQVHIACNSITLGPNVNIVAPGDVDLRAGGSVALLDNVSVGTGASLTVANDPSLIQSSTWTFVYEAPEYYLTDASGPWGVLAWEYDEIGNREKETRDGAVEDYTYVQNAGSGNSPILSQVLLVSGSRDYTYGTAGHLEFFDADANEIDFSSDDAGRLASVVRLPGTEEEDTATFLYDGRSFLSRSERPFGLDLGFVEASYSSAGLLHGLRRQESMVEPIEEVSVFYFAGRPVAQRKDVDTSSDWTFLTTDHLGTPLLATDDAGFDIWAGPFEPFGEDTFQNALGSDVFLRLPGQWVDNIWQSVSLGANVYYNVHRWYEFGTGRYGRPDPLGFSGGDVNLYSYGRHNPLFFTDPLGEALIPVNCSASQAAQIQDSQDQVEDAAKSCVPCQDKDKLREKLQEDITVECRSDLFNPPPRDCAGIEGPNEIVIFETGFSPPGCGCLPSVLFHEVLHTIGLPEHETQHQTRKCFDCAQPPPRDPFRPLI